MATSAKRNQLVGFGGEVDQRTIREFCQRFIEVLEPAHDVGERCGGPEILLLEAKLLSDYKNQMKRR